tara:strand:- start:34 stop:639 length:606 start_codon:yes stop_codon:yes gene_type:complete
MNIHQLGEEFCDFLHKQNVTLTENNDGRLESLNSEDAVTDLLRENFTDVNFLDKGHNRSFGDIDIEIDGKVYPVNVKMVDEKTGTYNGGGPKVFNYVLFGKKDTGWKRLVNDIKENRPTKIHSEYFYLVYYKRSNKKPQFVSLTDIDNGSIVTNPSNPIQLKQNLTTTDRDEKGKVDFMVGLLTDVLYKRAQPYLELSNEH